MLSVAGCALFVGAIGGDGLAVSPEGIAWGLAAAVFFAAYSLMGEWASRGSLPGRFWSTGSRSRRSSGSSSWGHGRSCAAEDQTVLAAVLAMAVVSTIIPFGAFLAALRYIDPTRALVTSTLEPVIAGVAAFLLFGESFSASQLLGGALVLARSSSCSGLLHRRSRYRLRSGRFRHLHDFTLPPRENAQTWYINC